MIAFAAFGARNGERRVRKCLWRSLLPHQHSWYSTEGKWKACKRLLGPSGASMSLQRILFFSSKQRGTDASRLLQRFGCNRGAQSCNYSKSSRYSHEKQITDRITAEKAESTHSWRNYVVPTLVVGSFAGFAILVHYNDERRAIPKGTGNQVNARIGPMVGGPFTLIDTERWVITEKDFLRNWVLLYFGYTSSPDVGPEQLKIMAKAIDLLESQQKVKILPVFVTIDPQRDTPAHLQAYLKEFDPRIVGLTGLVTAIRQMAQEYRVYFRKVEEEGDDYLVESSHNMYLLNPNMEVVRCFGIEYGADELSKEILDELERNPS